MIVSPLKSLSTMNIAKQGRKLSFKFLLIFLVCISLLAFSPTSAWASIDDDRYEGNIFVVFAGNGSLVPPRLSWAETRQRKLPSLLVFYVDDSKDCKQFSVVVSRLQDYYGWVAGFIPVSVDSLSPKSTYTKDEVGYYYEGVVPQTVLLDEEGKVIFNGKGQVKFEAIDDAFREVFDLLPRSESIELKRRTVNEYNTELAE